MCLDVLGIIPENTMMLFSVDFVKIVKNKNFKDIKAELMKKPENKLMILELEKTGGLKLEDLKSYHAFGLQPEKMENSKIKPALAFVVEAPVNETKFIQFLKETAKSRKIDFDTSVKSEKYMGYNVYSGKTSKDIEISAFVKEGEALFAGTKQEITNIIDALGKKGRSIYDNKVMSQMISGMAGKKLLWLAFDLKSVPADQKFKDNPQTMILNDLEQLTLTFEMENSAELIIKGYSEIKGVCQKISGMLNGYIGMLRMMAGQNPLFQTLIDCLSVTGNEKTCTLEINIDQAVMETLKEQVKGMIPQPGNMGPAHINPKTGPADVHPVKADPKPDKIIPGPDTFDSDK
jgi:hypothetical protein